ncbi:DNA sulfur modification protein DndB [uncultured Nostoc sp.]|uniref:DNA sulfur modification protein DndB n=1 Tax=uncultured Nostoc sp. TaxID=340711 RepID=UPI0035CB216C
MHLVKQHLTSNSDLLKIIELIRLENYGKERVYFGLGDYQGGRLIIQIVVYFSEIPTLVPIVNRPVNIDHVNEIKDYVLQRIQSNKAWILGSLTLNVNKNDIKYQSLGNRLYIVRVPNGTTMQIADGQHRIQVITELMASSKHRCLIADEHGHRDNLESEIRVLIKQYVSEHEPID